MKVHIPTEVLESLIDDEMTFFHMASWCSCAKGAGWKRSADIYLDAAKDETVQRMHRRLTEGVG